MRLDEYMTYSTRLLSAKRVFSYYLVDRALNGGLLSLHGSTCIRRIEAVLHVHFCKVHASKNHSTFSSIARLTNTSSTYQYFVNFFWLTRSVTERSLYRGPLCPIQYQRIMLLVRKSYTQHVITHQGHRYLNVFLLEDFRYPFASFRVTDNNSSIF